MQRMSASRIIPQVTPDVVGTERLQSDADSTPPRNTVTLTNKFPQVRMCSFATYGQII